MLRKLVMYISAFLPMLIIMWGKAVLMCAQTVMNQPNENNEYNWKLLYLNPYIIAEFVFIVIMCLAVCWLLKRNKRTGVYTVFLKSVKNRSAEYYLAYYSLFILALIEFSLTDPIDLMVLLLLLCVLGIVYIKNDLFFMNPTINIFQSFIFEVEYQTDQETITKLIISPHKLAVGDTVDIDISEFEFTFLRRKHEQSNQNES